MQLYMCTHAHTPAHIPAAHSYSHKNMHARPHARIHTRTHILWKERLTDVARFLVNIEFVAGDAKTHKAAIVILTSLVTTGCSLSAFVYICNIVNTRFGQMVNTWGTLINAWRAETCSLQDIAPGVSNMRMRNHEVSRACCINKNIGMQDIFFKCVVLPNVVTFKACMLYSQL